MKVNISHTLFLEDEEVSRIADVLDGRLSKRLAKREEVKGYLWSHGKDWSVALDEDHEALFGPTEKAAPDDSDEDLIGAPAEASDEDLIGAPSESAGDTLEDLL